MPFKSNLEKYVAEEDEHFFNEANLSYLAITPEYRLYLGKGYGKGFYFAPYYRYSKLSFEKVNITFRNDLNITEKLALDGTLTGNSLGLMTGVSFYLSKHIVLDWWILGAHYGKSKGDAIGVSIRTFSATEQAAIQEALKDIDMPNIDEKITVNTHGGTIDFKGDWAGLRSGITLGVKF